MCPYGHGKNKEAKEMKKTLIAVAAAAALATTSAFAEITFGAWLRAIAVPVASNGEDIVTALTNSWGYGARTARLNVTAVSEDGKAGFNMGIYNDAFDGLGDGDSTSMWVKPIDMLKISFGKFDSGDDGLRGDFTYGSWAWLRPYNWLYDGEGLTFSGVQNTGALVELDPIEGLHVAVNIPFVKAATYTSKEEATIATKDSLHKITDGYSTVEAEDTYKMAQVALGYNIDGIGTVKAQWIGKNDKIEKEENYFNGKAATYYGDIEAAFDLKAVDNLYVTFGGRFSAMDGNYYKRSSKDKAAKAGSGYTWVFTKDADGNPAVSDAGYWEANEGSEAVELPTLKELAKIALGVSYNIMDGLTVSADGAVAFYNGLDEKWGGITYKYEQDPRFSFGVGVSYVILGVDGLSVDADVRYLSKAKVKYTYGDWTKTVSGEDANVEYVDDNASKTVFLNGRDSISFLIGLNKTVGSNGLIGVGFQGVTHGYGFSNGAIEGVEDKFSWAVPVKLQFSF
jgi:hypothetical protein